MWLDHKMQQEENKVREVGKFQIVEVFHPLLNRSLETGEF